VQPQKLQLNDAPIVMLVVVGIALASHRAKLVGTHALVRCGFARPGSRVLGRRVAVAANF
jgi:hypothetical protein